MWQSVAQSELRTVNTVCDTEGSTRPALPSPALPLIHCTLGNWPTGKSHYSVMIQKTQAIQGCHDGRYTVKDNMEPHESLTCFVNELSSVVVTGSNDLMTISVCHSGWCVVRRRGVLSD